MQEDSMTAERSPQDVFQGLYAQAICLWGQQDAERQRQALRQTAEELAAMTRWALPADLEPRFF
jgi:hypothetical protein